MIQLAVYALKEHGNVPSRDPCGEPTPDLCPKCAGELEVFRIAHFFTAGELSEWRAWSSCPVCRQFYVRRDGLPRSVEVCGWQVDRDPPDFVRKRGRRNQSGLYDRELDG
jgi:hypothetical protein